MLKEADNPPVMPPDVDGPSALTGPWWIAHTKARAERALAWDLLRQRIGYFLPLAGRTTVWAGRRRTSSVPVFPSYLFFCGTRDDRQAVLATGRVCQVIEIREQARLVGEMQAVYRAIGSKLQLETYPFTAVGRRCRIARGAMRGTEGVVIRKDDVTRLVLSVSLLGQSVALQVPADVIEPAD